MLKYKMSGVTAGKVMKALDKILNALFQESLDQEACPKDEPHFIRSKNISLQSKWLCFLQNLNSRWEWIEKKDNFSEDDLLSFTNTWLPSCNNGLI
jgi:hypothetical protein